MKGRQYRSKALSECLEYLRHLARRMREIAGRCFDLGTAGELRQLSDEAEAKSRALDDARRPR
ncbi:MAG: hypothetical protein JO000_28805 [Alphaproteobacteria bacterium]|nr:hypothetical protein [Alphaproteobacteria bacterium]